MTPLKTTITSFLLIVFFSALTCNSFTPTNQCSSEIKSSKQEFSINEPVLISYSIKNESKDTIKIWHSGFWRNNRIVLTDNKNLDVPRTSWGETTSSAFSPGGNRDMNFPVTLSPGETDSAYEKYNLKDHFLIEKSGIYNAVYFYHEIDANSEIKIKSNTLQIKIHK